MKRSRQSANTRSIAVNPTADPGCCESKGVLQHRTTWRNAIEWLTSPAFRVHRYRNIHTQMRRAALRTLDCGKISHDRDARNE